MDMQMKYNEGVCDVNIAVLRFVWFKIILLEFLQSNGQQTPPITVANFFHHWGTTKEKGLDLDLSRLSN